MIFFDAFSFDWLGLVVFVEVSFGFWDSLKDDKCIMKFIKEVIKLLVIRRLNGKRLPGMGFGVAELSILFGGKRDF